MSETIKTISNHAIKVLTPEYEITELKSILRIIFEDTLDWNLTQQIINSDQELSPRTVITLKKIIEELSKGKPIQYIMGHEYFNGLKLKVTQATLIPRPETEELVIKIIESNHAGSSIIDIGTGSGAIAIALAKGIKGAHVTACDISSEAIDIAKENCTNNGVDIEFIEADILKWEEYHFEKYSTIVSNPPYITENEKSGMERRVLDYEPHSALFVPDNDPLLFYRRIAEFGTTHLIDNGELWFEINQAFGRECCDMLSNLGYTNIELHKDNFNNDRIVKATWSR